MTLEQLINSLTADQLTLLIESLETEASVKELYDLINRRLDQLEP